jgi:hypothetical protein
MTPPSGCQSGRYAQHLLVLSRGRDGATRLLLLAALLHGVPEVRRAHCWPAGTADGALLAGISAAYRAAARQSHTRVVLASADLSGSWPALVRRAVGPLAVVETLPTPATRWADLVRLGLAIADPETVEDDEYVAVLIERAAARS